MLKNIFKKNTHEKTHFTNTLALAYLLNSDEVKNT